MLFYKVLQITGNGIPFRLTNLNRIDQVFRKLLVRNGKPSQQGVGSLCTCNYMCVCIHIVQYTQLYLWFLNFLLELYVERLAEYVKDNTAGFSTLGCIERIFILCLVINLLGTHLPARLLEFSKIISEDSFPWLSLLCGTSVLQHRGNRGGQSGVWNCSYPCRSL